MEEKIKEHYSPYGQPEAANDLKDRIVSALKQAGKDIQNLEIKDLSIIDQLHTGGHLATIEIVKRAGLNPDAKILDAGCGIGGSSRLLANEFQLKVTGIDIVDEFIQTAGFLTDLVAKNYNLNNLVEFNQGSILELPSPDGIYDAVLSQHTLMNIKEKDVLFNELFARQPFSAVDFWLLPRGEEDAGLGASGSCSMFRSDGECLAYRG